MDTIFWRLAWKEYRQQRELMAAIAIITVVIYAVISLIRYLQNEPQWVAGTYHLAFAMPVFYALGCGATLFAGEHERETFGLLRSLSVRSSQVFWAKLAAGVATSLALIAILGLLAALATSFKPLAATDDPLGLLAYVAATFVVLLCAVLYSLLLKNPLWAVVAAGTTYLTGVVAIAALLSLLQQMLNLETNMPWLIMGVASAVLFIALLAASVGLGRRWLEREPGVLPRLLSAPVEEPAGLHAASGRKRFGRLLWHSLRENAVVYGILYALVCLFTVLALLDTAASSSPPGPLPWALLLLPVVMGSLAFFPDQWKQQYRFFAEHGVNPRTLWWSRIAAALVASMPWLLLVLLFLAATQPVYEPGRISGGQEGGYVWPWDLLTIGVLTFAWAQLSSLLFRAGILGFFVGASLALAWVFWLTLVRFLGIPDWLGVFPLVAILLWASWLRAPDWLSERDGWRPWLRWLGLVSLPAALYLVTLAAHRAYEIPDLARDTLPSGSLSGSTSPSAFAAQHVHAYSELMRPTTPEERITADRYRSLSQEMRILPGPVFTFGEGAGPPSTLPPGAEPQVEEAGAALPESANEINTQRSERRANLVNQFIEVSQRPDCDFAGGPLAMLPASESRLAHEIVAAVEEHAIELVQAGKHAEALDCYTAMDRFLRHYQQRGDWIRISQSIELEAGVYENVLREAAKAFESADEFQEAFQQWKPAPHDWKPDFQIARMREYLLTRAMVDLDRAAWQTRGSVSPEQEPAFRVLRWMPWERERSRRLIDYQALFQGMGGHDAMLSRWERNTVLQLYLPAPEHARQLEASQSTHRAALQLRLLLLAWQAENDSLPESLEELQKAYPESATIRSHSARPLLYRPQGLDVELNINGLPSVPAGTPFVWGSPELPLSYAGITYLDHKTLFAALEASEETPLDEPGAAETGATPSGGMPGSMPPGVMPPGVMEPAAMPPAAMGSAAMAVNPTVSPANRIELWQLGRIYPLPSR